MSLESKASIKLSHSKKKFLQKEIPKLNKNEYHEIFNIIKQNADAKYSENSRGVYINLKFLDILTIEKIINFIKYTKMQKNKLEKPESNKKNSLKDTNSDSSDNSTRITLTKDTIEKELLRLKEKKNENFVFQNFLDKLSISNIKQFSKDEEGEKMVFPQLKHSKINLDGVKARLMKKCRDVNKTGTDLPFIPTDDIESDDLSINNDDNDEEKEEKEEQKEKEKEKLHSDEKTNIEKLISNIDNELDSMSDISEFNNF
tara:strand:+ start:275 stop:1048 length:774 start_codon:yes stop_codon:yes gene_type:complete